MRTEAILEVRMPASTDGVLRINGGSGAAREAGWPPQITHDFSDASCRSSPPASRTCDRQPFAKQPVAGSHSAASACIFECRHATVIHKVPGLERHRKSTTTQATRTGGRMDGFNPTKYITSIQLSASLNVTHPWIGLPFRMRRWTRLLTLCPP